MKIVDFIMNQILGQTYILFAIIAFIGYMALKESFSKAATGAIKTAIGVMVMGQGASLMIGTFNSLLNPLNEKFGMTGILLDVYVTMSTANTKLGEYASWSAYTLLVSFCLNLIFVALSKYTRIRTVFLTGNVMLIQTAISTYIVYYFFHTGMIATVLIASVITTLYWGIFSGLLIKPVKEITGSEEFSIGHQQMLGSYLAYKIASKLGKKEQDVETMQLPKWLSIFQDTIVASSIVLIVFVGIIMLALGKDVVSSMAGTTNWIIYIFKTGLTLSVALFILLTGVKLFVAEIMESFKGITKKLLPGAVVAVDCAAIFSFSPKAVLLGFLGGSLGTIVAIVTLIAIGSPMFIIPGFIPLFFDNATIGVFANKRGGYKAALIITFFVGVIQVLGSGLAATAMELNVWQGCFDFATIWLGIIYVFKWIASLFGLIII